MITSRVIAVMTVCTHSEESVLQTEGDGRESREDDDAHAPVALDDAY